MKTIIAILLLLSAITVKGQVKDIVDYENTNSNEPIKTITKKNTVERIIGYGASLPLAGAAYSMDGLIYLSLGSVATVISCWPVIATAIATNGATGVAAPFCFHLTKAYSAVEDYHPHIGHYVWEDTRPWREP